MREPLIGGFTIQMRDLFAEAKETYARTKARVEEMVQQASDSADGETSSRSRFLSSNADVVDMGRSPPLVKRTLQTLGSLFASGLLIGGLACLALALFQLMAAFVVMTRLLGIHIDIDPTGAPA